MSLAGTFPFGQPSGRCQPQRVAEAEAFVMGVYPSALHIRWVNQDFRVAALAVDEEPWPFWDGADQDQRVQTWQTKVGWQPAWGKVAPAGRLNGSSGVSVRDHVLNALGIEIGRVWLTDAVPFFHVHRGPGTQGAAMSSRYDVFARQHGLPLHNLPDRPSPDRLIQYAVEQELVRLREELLDSKASLVITLGNEALAVAAALVEGDLPRALSPGATYGATSTTRIEGRTIQVLPLVHPGQRAAVWRAAHDRWRESRAEGQEPS